MWAGIIFVKKMISNCYFILCLSRPIYFIKLKIRLGMNPTQIGIILESIDSDVKNDFKIVFEIKMFFYLPKKDIFRINLRTNSFFKIQDLQHKVLRRILLCPFHFIAHWLKEYIVNKCVLMTWVRQYATLSEQAQKYST